MRIRLQQLHLIAGLQVCVALFLLAVVGVVATLHRRPGHEGAAPQTRELVIRTVPGLDDQERARHVYDALKPPMTRPPERARRNEAGELRFDLYPPNATIHVRHDVESGRTVVKTEPRSLGQYLVYMHTLGGLRRPGQGWDVRIILWTLYAEFTALALLFLSVSGAVMLFRKARRNRPALVALAMSASFIGLVLLMVK